MLEDPLITWPGGFPYRLLAGIGITPQSTRAEVEDAVFTLMTEDLLNPATQQALNQLRDPARRLLLDLLLYDIGEQADFDRLDEAVAAKLANPGEPGEVTEALRTIPVDVLAGLADELTEPPRPPTGLAAFPTQSFLDSLIEFDR